VKEWADSEEKLALPPSTVPDRVIHYLLFRSKLGKTASIEIDTRHTLTFYDPESGHDTHGTQDIHGTHKTPDLRVTHKADVKWHPSNDDGDEDSDNGMPYHHQEKKTAPAEHKEGVVEGVPAVVRQADVHMGESSVGGQRPGAHEEKEGAPKDKGKGTKHGPDRDTYVLSARKSREITYKTLTMAIIEETRVYLKEMKFKTGRLTGSAPRGRSRVPTAPQTGH